jgi:hypothetical protein
MIAANTKDFFIFLVFLLANVHSTKALRIGFARRLATFQLTSTTRGWWGMG